MTERLLVTSQRTTLKVAKAGVANSNSNKSRNIADAKRLKRDKPNLWDQVVAGDMSRNAAAIAAGFRKPPGAIYRDPERWMVALE